MNIVALTGRLTADPQIYHSQEGKTIARFRLAVNRGKDAADFINCQAFDAQAENIEKYVKKGQKLDVVGSWRTGSYEKDGKTVYTNDCVVNRWEFGESRKAQESSPGVGEPDKDGFMQVPEGIDEELPFT